MHSLIYSLVCNYYGRKVGKKERKKADGRERRKKVRQEGRICFVSSVFLNTINWVINRSDLVHTITKCV